MVENNKGFEEEITRISHHDEKEDLVEENEESRNLLSDKNNMKRLNKDEDYTISLSSSSASLPSVSQGTDTGEYRRFSMEKEVDNTTTNKSFLRTFSQTSGPPQIALLCLIYALALGSTVGVVPNVMTDRYARINHGFSNEDNCSLYNRENKPLECKFGSEDAQNATAIASFISNMLTFLSSAIVGSISDRRGRKPLMLLGVVLFLIGPTMLVLIQIFKGMSPFWYYAGHAIAGIVNWMAVALSSLSDVIPEEWRASSFGLLLAGFSCGFAFSPMLTLCFSHFEISIVSWMLMVLALIINAFCIPETLPYDTIQEAKLKKDDYYYDNILKQDSSYGKLLLKIALRPFYEMSILNRDNLFRYLSALAFFSGMVNAADQSLFIYYAQDRLDFNDKDISIMFLIVGILGIIIQGCCIKPLQDLIGERFVLVVSFTFGAVSNFFYGIASSKTIIFVGIIISTVGGMAFPTISAIKANNVNDREQGRIQGALYSLQSLASALGPISLRIVYRYTKEYNPGFMFIFASFLFCIAVFFAFALPTNRANSKFVANHNNKYQQESKVSTDDNYIYGSL